MAQKEPLKLLRNTLTVKQNRLRTTNRFISCQQMQVACARTRVNLTNLCAITAHGRDPEPAKAELIRELKNGRNIFLLPDENFGSLEVAEVLKELGIEAELYTCENLGYPEERIARGTPENPPVPETMLYGLLVVQKR
jgi:cobalt-precorrin-7 (C5)-methyltransferase